MEKLGARYLAIRQGLYPRAPAELENAPPLVTVKGYLKLFDDRDRRCAQCQRCGLPPAREQCSSFF